MNISFFIENPHGRGIMVDNAIIFGITTHQYNQLSVPEKAFVTWYINESGNREVELVIGEDPESSEIVDILLDSPQVRICEEFMRIINARTV